METQVGATPWTELKGNVQNNTRAHSVESFRDCVKFHLLSVFSHDAVEQQKYYISHNIRKPRKIPIRNFADRIEKLNSYILLLPGLIDSPQGANMKRAKALDEPELAQLLLRLVPQAQQDQYLLIKGTIPVNLRATLDTLEPIEKMDIQVPRKAKKLLESGNGKGKRKGSPKNNGLPHKNKNSSKYCAICAKHGGAKSAHNTGDRKKYKKTRF